MMRHSKDPTPLIVQDSWDGAILTEPTGQGGFGYDPIFWSPEHKCSAAELSKQQKHEISHRGKAMRALLAQFTELQK
jgi:XTP/dITP diphosphohydrolase